MSYPMISLNKILFQKYLLKKNLALTSPSQHSYFKFCLDEGNHVINLIIKKNPMAISITERIIIISIPVSIS